MGLLDFHSTYKILFAVNLKHSSFWPSADVEPMQNCMQSPSSAHLLSLFVYFNLYGCVSSHCKIMVLHAALLTKFPETWTNLKANRTKPGLSFQLCM
jgi:hypothetical protein